MVIALRVGKLEENYVHPIRATCNLYFNWNDSRRFCFIFKSKRRPNNLHRNRHLDNVKFTYSPSPSPTGSLCRRRFNGRPRVVTKHVFDFNGIRILFFYDFRMETNDRRTFHRRIMRDRILSAFIAPTPPVGRINHTRGRRKTYGDVPRVCLGVPGTFALLIIHRRLNTPKAKHGISFRVIGLHASQYVRNAKAKGTGTGRG